MSGTTKRLTWLLFAVYIIQADVVIFMRRSALSSLLQLHPVLALVDFSLAVLLARRAWSLVRQADEALASPRTGRMRPAAQIETT